MGLTVSMIQLPSVKNKLQRVFSWGIIIIGDLLSNVRTKIYLFCGYACLSVFCIVECIFFATRVPKPDF